MTECLTLSSTEGVSASNRIERQRLRLPVIRLEGSNKAYLSWDSLAQEWERLQAPALCKWLQSKELLHAHQGQLLIEVKSIDGPLRRRLAQAYHLRLQRVRQQPPPALPQLQQALQPQTQLQPRSMLSQPLSSSTVASPPPPQPKQSPPPKQQQQQPPPPPPPPRNLLQQPGSVPVGRPPVQHQQPMPRDGPQALVLKRSLQQAVEERDPVAEKLVTLTGRLWASCEARQRLRDESPAEKQIADMLFA